MELHYYMSQRLPGYGLHLLRLCVWLICLTAIFTPLERLFALHPQKVFRKAIVIDLGYYFLSSLVPSALLTIPLTFLAWSAHTFIPSEFTSVVASWPVWLRMVASLVVAEIGFYWGHRWSHGLPLLWRFHAVHHSAEHVDFLVNTRAHPIDMVFTRLCGMMPLYVLGLGAPVLGSAGLIPALVSLLSTIWGFFIHANVRWRFGLLEWIVATPAFHHWHHTNDGPGYINKNFSSMLPWVDQLFGTLYLPKNKQPQRYGINETIPRSLFGQLLEPFLGNIQTSAPNETDVAQAGISPSSARETPQGRSSSS